ncbi:helix-turn-helix domain-containing protein [Acetobacter syzygii]|uniref:helix-turn-helix domain-containing protein n=1 Tax=Acetobacter syzygii TaxID=146476 RepID=UPI0039EB120A
MNLLSLSMGARLRARRKSMGLSLKDVAERAGVSVGYLSQIERDISSPSVKDLMEISRSLGTSASSFFEAATQDAVDSFVVRQAQRKITFFENGLTKQKLSPSAHDGMTMSMVVIEPGGGSGEVLYTHDGMEAGLVINGQLTLVIEDEVSVLNEGDSFQFSSQRPHRFYNSFADVTRVIWVNVGTKNKADKGVF